MDPPNPSIGGASRRRGITAHPTGFEGDSYMAGAQPALDGQFLTRFTGQGGHFSEQWKRALDVDPKLVMVTQWNEWIAQAQVATAANHPAFLARPTAVGQTYFVDLYNQEFNRHVEPMEGGHGDNHYYLMAGRIRRFKGMDAPAAIPGMLTMAMDGSFQDWAKAGPVYRDPRGDVAYRDYPRFDGIDPVRLRGWYWIRATSGGASAVSRGILLMGGASGDFPLSMDLR
jgi:hypothetical protein